MRGSLRALRVGTEKLVGRAANLAWPLVMTLGERFSGGTFQPPWAASPLEKQRQKSFPPLGWPRQTDSLCPVCVREARAAVLGGAMEMSAFLHEHPGEIKARIVERGGQVVMEKECPKHGAFDDVISIDPAFLSRIERLFPGRDQKALPTPLRKHGTSSIKYGRGSVLTVDLTNRCNMMCDPCFMDANQVGRS